MATETFRRSLARHLAVALPVGVASWLLAGWAGPFFANRLPVAAVAVPLGIACWALWRWLDQDRSVLLGPRFFSFLLCYCVLFALLAGSDVLTWKRTLVGYEDQVPPNWLGRLVPPMLSDWHYRIAPEAPPAPDLVVVTLPSFAGRPPAESRRTFAALIGQATRQGAKGIALDYILEQPSPQADQRFCREVEHAIAAGVPVFVGYDYDEKGGTIVERPLASTVLPCLPATRRGSLSGSVDQDGVLRMVPLFLKRDQGLPALSLQIARTLAGNEPARPPGDLLQLVRPQGGIVRFDGVPRGADLRLLQGNFVVVGTASLNDRNLTPYGPLQGAEIHAWAAHDLRTGSFIRRLPLVWTFPTLFALCYLLTAILARGSGWRRLLSVAGLLSLVIVASAVLAMRFGWLWIDVSYPLVAIWGLVGLLLAAGGALRRRTMAPVRQNAERLPPSQVFDVFLSHNGNDESVVRELAEALRARGLRPWLDKDELIPGRPWQKELERNLAEAKTVAVLVGKDGLGPWEEVEMRAGLSLFVERGKPAIPVLLEGASDQPNLPLFLTQYTWVDLRKGLTKQGLDHLQWAITGIKPVSR
ncbi:MAG TPA: TIR domain-containing protein [Thermoanaerobaculia bacterium]|nr:TIR domain-containing protein [Thermoanaerobaculia bacterium]